VYDHHIYPITEMRDYSELETAYSLSRTEPSMCVAYTPNQGTYLTPGPELDHATLPGAVLAETTCPSRFTAGTRLKGLAQHWDDDALDTISFFDPEFNAKCTLRAAADGAWRCLPEQQTFVSDTYVDAQCTRRAATYRCPPNPADGYDRRDYALDLRQPDPTDRCARELALVYELTGPVVEQTYAKGSDGACTPSGSTRYSRELGAEINAERFVAFSCPDTPAGCFAGVF
jgi:hypothetical protein